MSAAPPELTLPDRCADNPLPPAVIRFTATPVDFRREAAPILDDLVVGYLRTHAVDETQRLVEAPARAGLTWGTGGESGDGHGGR